jgi:lipopolysaccharide/colanic/teichoic acid biosynthesis glycosyltransferase
MQGRDNGVGRGALGTDSGVCRAPRRKRLLDMVVAFVALVVALPLVVLLAVLVLVTLRANPFFAQTRIGQGGREFRLLKLRTLPPSAPDYTTKNNLDVPIPRFCRFLRRTHLDELPQLLSVLRGRLSLVGPRPKMPDCFEPAPPEYCTMRQRIPQGCTGLWQISEHQYDLPDRYPQYDAYYLANWSMRLDLWILACTLLQFASLRRPVTLASVPRWVSGRGFSSDAPVADGRPVLGAAALATPPVGD